MMTCMIRSKYVDVSESIDYNLNNFHYKNIFVIVFICIPLASTIFGLYEGYTMIRIILQSNDDIKKRIFKTFGFTLIVYVFLIIFMIILYFIDFFTNGSNISIHFQYTSFIFTCLTVLTPVLIGIVQLSQVFYTYAKIYNCLCCKKKSPYTLAETSLLSQSVITTDSRSDLERVQDRVNRAFLANIYLAISYCMEVNKTQQQEDVTMITDYYNEHNNKPNVNVNASVNVNDTQNDLIETSAKATKVHEISQTTLHQLSECALLNDAKVLKTIDLSFTCHEHAPSVFSYLRDIDNISNDIIISSCLPSLNESNFERSQGKSQSLFLTTHNKEFIIKTITQDDINLIKDQLLHKLCNYFTAHSSSLISRLYGVYSLTISDGTTYHFILMKDVCGVLENNITSKYDLKGSKLNRDVALNAEKVDTQVLKDVNYKEHEGAMRLRKDDADNIAAILHDDVFFLASNGIMDYSLFVVNVDLNINEVNTLYGRGHFEAMHVEYQKRMYELVDDDEEAVDVEALNDNEKDALYNEGHVRFNWRNVKRINKHLFPGLSGNKAVILAIIDYFQVYNINKRLETGIKHFLKGNVYENISSMPADGYGGRFLEKIIPIIKGKDILADYNESSQHNP